MQHGTSTGSRRRFLHQTAAAIGSFAVVSSFRSFAGRTSADQQSRLSPGFGPLNPTPDEATGLNLLLLPEGFRYRSFGWTGDEMSDGRETPRAHDGMGVIGHHGSVVTLCRNHEIMLDRGLIGDDAIAFDRKAGGGCTLLKFQAEKGEWLGSRPGLAGTALNCAGGPTPWGSWLSCEETVVGPGDVKTDASGRPLAAGQADDDAPPAIWEFERDHGWIFEVPADAPTEAIALEDMGRFVHEAVAVDPHTGIVYETEDRNKCGFYRFLPGEPGRLAAGGRLQMMKVPGERKLRRDAEAGCVYDVEWVDIEDPRRRHSPGTTDTKGVYHQGRDQDATAFARLEGCWYGNERIYFVSTIGGREAAGQIWMFNPAQQQLELVFESPSKDVMYMPDNIAVTPRGGLLMCEDSDYPQQRLHGMTQDGWLFEVARNNIELKGERNGITGDFRGGEWAGACFDESGEWLFVNIQNPGITFAINGLWSEAGL